MLDGAWRCVRLVCVIHDKPLGWNAFDARGGTSRGVSWCASRLCLLGDVAAFLLAAALLRVAFSLYVFLAGAFCAFCVGALCWGCLALGAVLGMPWDVSPCLARLRVACGKGKAL